MLGFTMADWKRRSSGTKLLFCTFLVFFLPVALVTKMPGGRKLQLSSWRLSPGLVLKLCKCKRNGRLAISDFQYWADVVDKLAYLLPNQACFGFWKKFWAALYDLDTSSSMFDGKLFHLTCTQGWDSLYSEGLCGHRLGTWKLMCLKASW